MKILILTQWYPPEPALLLQELAQTLQADGHDVEVLTGFPNYPSGYLYPGYDLRWRKREILAGIPVTRVVLYPDHSGAKIKRILNYFSFAFSCTLLGPWLILRPDVIFVYHPPLTVGLPAFVLSRLWRVPFVYQVQDMWPETLSATGMVNNQRILKWISAFAQWIYHQAQAIFVISPGFRQNLIDKGVPADKVHIVSNWVDVDLYHPEEADPKLAEELGLVGKFNVMFAGNIGKAQGLETVVEAAALVADNKDIQFVVVGDGVALPQIKAFAKENRLTNIRFLGRYPATEMSKLYALADVLLVHLRDDPLFRITIPHKILSYLGVAKPVLAALRGDGAALIRDADAGAICPPQSPEALADAVRLFYNLPDEDRTAMGERALHMAHTKYDRLSLVSEIEVVLREAVVENRSTLDEQ